MVFAPQSVMGHGDGLHGCVLAAIDLSASSSRVLRHAAGFARLFGARLRVLHVARDSSGDELQRVIDFCAAEGPYEVDLDDDSIVIRTGFVSEAIHREAVKQKARLVVMGSRGHGRLTTFLLGSTSEAVLRNAPAPILLVPPIDLDIINISDRATLTCGPVLAAIDLTESCGEQLTLAGELAHLASQPMLMMTVAPARLSEHQAATLLRHRAHANAPVKPRSLVVRHGDVAEEISRCAVSEGAGLVVMGLRAKPGGRPGAIASAVLQTNRAFVLAVPAS
jgi:nucleotide-binding universal stress UspA family protein